MLSRRNIRIKVMQMLYAMNRDEALDYEKAERRYDQYINASFNAYLLCIMQVLKIAEYAKKDAGKRAAKHLPQEFDLIFTPKLFENEAIQSLATNRFFLSYTKKRHVTGRLDEDFTQKMYNKFAKTKEYIEYIETKETTTKDDLKIILDLFKFFVKHADFEDFIEDILPTWEDDKSLVIGAVKKTLKELPVKDEFYLGFFPDAETTDEFGADLFYKVDHFNEKLLKLIIPTLKNWEADRVAVLDMVLIKMALAEMLYFPTIPTKVTINEYIDISKLYSTPKSKNFINGILDKLLKQLSQDGGIHKEGRGLKD